MPKTSNLILAVMNGLAGFRGLYGKHPEIIESVHQVLDSKGYLYFNRKDGLEVLKKKGSAENVGYCFSIRGSGLRANPKEMQAFIEGNNIPDNRLVAVGHSTGAWNLHHILNRVSLAYQAITFISVDMNYPGIGWGNRNEETFEIQDERVIVKNFSQNGRLGGMMYSRKNQTVDVLETRVHNTTHADISYSQPVKEAIRGAI